MNIGRALSLACLASVVILLSIGWLPGTMWRNSDSRNEVAVFQNAPIEHLTNSNLVDMLIGVKLKERIGKAEWRNAVLSVELRVDPVAGRPVNWFKDIERLIDAGFNQLDNVKRVLIRIAELETEGGRLLAAIDVRSTDSWLQADLNRLADADPVHDEIWKSRLRFSHTSAWEERFGKISGFITTSPHRSGNSE